MNPFFCFLTTNNDPQLLVHENIRNKIWVIVQPTNQQRRVEICCWIDKGVEAFTYIHYMVTTILSICYGLQNKLQM